MKRILIPTLFTFSILISLNTQALNNQLNKIALNADYTQETLNIDKQTHTLLQDKLKVFIISQNILEAERGNIEVKSVNLNADCTQFKMTYTWKHSLKSWENEEMVDVKDVSEFDIAIHSLEITNNIARIKMTITKKYIETAINFYGITYENEHIATFPEEIELPLDKTNSYKTNKISEIYEMARGRKLRRDELKLLSIDELGYLRNEFYARKGYRFKTAKMQQYFNPMRWYKPIHESSENLLNDMELENVYLIKAMEEEIKLNASVDERTKLSQLYTKGRTIKLSKADLNHLNAHQLAYLRNEFYARHGYIFMSQRLADYFSKTDWYTPKFKNVDEKLTPIELENVMFIKQLENQLN